MVQECYGTYVLTADCLELLHQCPPLKVGFVPPVEPEL